MAGAVERAAQSGVAGPIKGSVKVLKRKQCEEGQENKHEARGGNFLHGTCLASNHIQCL